MRWVVLYFSLFVFSYSFAQTDTVNRIDKNSKKTGYWIIYGISKIGKGYADSAIVEEGRYEAGRKTGVWKTYYQHGILKSVIEFKNNRPNGKFVTYYANGRVEERGTWKQTFYNDTFELFYPSGQRAQLKHFNGAGKSDGQQMYWYPDGVLELEFSSKNGEKFVPSIKRNEVSAWKRSTIPPEGLCFCNIDTMPQKIIYLDHPSGDTVILFYFNDEKFVRLQGKFSGRILQNGYCEIDASLHSNYAPASQWEVRDGNLYLKGDNVKIPENETKYNTIYNSNKQIWMDGEFNKGKLWNGKKYIYDENGKLLKVEIYKQGNYYADGQIDPKMREENKK